MKTLTLLLLLIISLSAQSQPSIDAGLMSRMNGTFSIAVEKQAAWNNTQINVRASTDNLRPVIGLQTGYSTRNDFQRANYRFMAGVFYHTAILPVNKDTREQQIRFGGSARLEMNRGTVMLEYNGETLAFTLGLLFKTKI